MRLQWMLGVLLACALAIPTHVQAQSVREMTKQVEASMLVTGTVDIDHGGMVTSHALDQREKLPEYVVNLVERAVPAMRFEPILADGQPVLARAKMSLRVVATPADDGNMTIAIRSAHFGEPRNAASAGIRSENMAPPRYPAGVAQVGGKGIVYLLVRIGRDGKVVDVFPEQVNLTALGTGQQMALIRKRLSDAAAAAGRKWTFLLSEEALAKDREHWVVRIPVDFHFTDERDREYGEWSAYVPGPKQKPSWARPDPPGFSPDAVAGGGIHPEDSKFRLLTPLGG